MDIGLVDAIRVLRSELTEAMQGAEEAPVRFRVESVDLEMNVVIGTSVDGGGSIRFWVVSVGGKGSRSSAKTHTLKLSLQAVTRTGEQVFTSDRLETMPE